MRERGEEKSKEASGWQEKSENGKKAETISGYGKQVAVRMVNGGAGEDAVRQQHGRDDAGSGSGAA